jgi:hypothetical protein
VVTAHLHLQQTALRFSRAMAMATSDWFGVAALTDPWPESAECELVDSSYSRIVSSPSPRTSPSRRHCTQLAFRAVIHFLLSPSYAVLL